MEIASIVAGAIFSLVALMLFAFVLPKTLKKRKRMEEIVRTGYSAIAQVTSCTSTGRSANGSRVVLLDLRVTTSDGTVFQAKVKAVIPDEQLSAYEAGANVTVKYLERSGRKECVVEGTQAAGRHIS